MFYSDAILFAKIINEQERERQAAMVINIAIAQCGDSDIINEHIKQLLNSH